MQRILETVRGFDGVLEVAPTSGDMYPELTWGDHFFYYAPDGEVPQREQPYATIVTKNYPDDTLSELDKPGRWRLNVHVGKAAFTTLLGTDPQTIDPVPLASCTDTVIPHPVYAAQAWISVVSPIERTRETVVELLRQAHDFAMSRANRRSSGSTTHPERHDPHRGQQEA